MQLIRLHDYLYIFRHNSYQSYACYYTLSVYSSFYAIYIKNLKIFKFK